MIEEMESVRFFLFQKVAKPGIGVELGLQRPKVRFDKITAF